MHRTLPVLLALLAWVLLPTSSSAVVFSVGFGSDCALAEFGELDGDGGPCESFSPDITPGSGSAISFVSGGPIALGEDTLLSIVIDADDLSRQSIDFTVQDNGAPTRFALVLSVPLAADLFGALSYKATLDIACANGNACLLAPPVTLATAPASADPFGPFTDVVDDFGAAGVGSGFASTGGVGGGGFGAGGGFGVGGGLLGLGAISALAGLASSGPIAATGSAPCQVGCNTLVTAVVLDMAGGGETVTVSTSLEVPEPQALALPALAALALTALRTGRARRG